MMDEGEYEVYTQYSSWTEESKGDWQNLVSGIEISNLGIRTTEGAIPMVAIRNKGNGKIFVFHLMPNANWKIKVSRVPLVAKNNKILIETGINESRLHMDLKKGEEILMPKVYLFECENPIDLDAWKLHTAFLRDFKRKEMPVIYNTWMSNFHYIDFDEMARQAETAAELSIEYFLIDAGWFGGKTSWGTSVGDWEELPDGRLDGRLEELSEYVRSLGLNFGLWIEPERATTYSKAYKEHPEYYYTGNGCDAVLNFGCKEAREYMFNVISGLIEKYSLKIMKFDFNTSLGYDETGNGFYRYFEGQRKFLHDLKEKYPDLYLINCASGGYRMEMNQMEYFDSVWISDNQSPVEGVRIFKDTAKHFLPSAMEKWDVRVFSRKFPSYDTNELRELPLSCHNGTWDSIIRVSSNFTHAFITGGVMGFSANIADYPQSEKDALKGVIAKYKNEREFYRNSVMRILHDNKNIITLQYSDNSLENNIIHIFTTYLFQNELTIYPALIADKQYKYGEQTLKGQEIMDSGITVPIYDYNCTEIMIKAVN